MCRWKAVTLFGTVAVVACNLDFGPLLSASVPCDTQDIHHVRLAGKVAFAPSLVGTTDGASGSLDDVVCTRNWLLGETVGSRTVANLTITADSGFAAEFDADCLTVGHTDSTVAYSVSVTAPITPVTSEDLAEARRAGGIWAEGTTELDVQSCLTGEWKPVVMLQRVHYLRNPIFR